MGSGTLGYIVTRFLQLVAMLATIKIMTIQLEPVELAKYNIMMIIFGLFSLLLITPVNTYINRRQHEWTSAGVIRNRIGRSTLYFIGVTVFSAFIIHFFLQSLQQSFGLSNHWLIICISSSLLLTSLNVTLISYLNIQGYYNAWAMLTQVTLWSSLLLAYWFTSLENNAIYWFIGILSGQSLGFMAALIPYLLSTKASSLTSSKPLSEDTVRATLNFMIPVAVGVGLGWVQYLSYRLMIGYVVDLNYLGLFIAGYSISSGIFQAFETTIQQYIYPNFYRQISGKARSEISTIWAEYYQTIIPMIFLAMVFIITMSKPLLHILVDAKYWTAVQFVMLGAVVEALRVTGNVYVLATHALMKTSRIIVPQLMGALMVVMLIPLSMYFKQTSILTLSLIMAGLVYVGLLHVQVRNLLSIDVKMAHMGKVLFATLIFSIFSEMIHYFSLNGMASFVLMSLCGILYLMVNYAIVYKSVWFYRSTVLATEY